MDSAGRIHCPNGHYVGRYKGDPLCPSDRIPSADDFEWPVGADYVDGEPAECRTCGAPWLGDLLRSDQ